MKDNESVAGSGDLLGRYRYSWTYYSDEAVVPGAPTEHPFETVRIYKTKVNGAFELDGEEEAGNA